MKRKIIRSSLVVLILGCLSAPPVQAQGIGGLPKSARTAAAGITVSTKNGITTVVYKGKEVWTGKTAGRPYGRSTVQNGVEYVAAFDGDKVIWENVRGAGAKVK